MLFTTMTFHFHSQVFFDDCSSMKIEIRVQAELTSFLNPQTLDVNFRDIGNYLS